MPQRLALQIRLRTLLLLVAVAGSGIGLYGLRLRNQHQAFLREQKTAVVRVVQRRGRIQFDDGQRLQRSFNFNSDLASRHPSRVRAISFSHNKDLSDDDLKVLRLFPNLETLTIAGGNVTPRGLSVLGDLPKLRILSIGMAITDADIRRLSQLQSLKEIYLMGPTPGGYTVRDSAAARLYDSDRYDSEITDRGIRLLARLLPGCKITY